MRIQKTMFMKSITIWSVLADIETRFSVNVPYNVMNTARYSKITVENHPPLGVFLPNMIQVFMIKLLRKL